MHGIDELLGNMPLSYFIGVIVNSIVTLLHFIITVINNETMAMDIQICHDESVGGSSEMLCTNLIISFGFYTLILPSI